jgi:hypothetical protein
MVQRQPAFMQTECLALSICTGAIKSKYGSIQSTRTRLKSILIFPFLEVVSSLQISWLKSCTHFLLSHISYTFHPYAYIDIHIHTKTYVLTFVHTYIHAFIHTYILIHTYIHTFIRVHTYIYTHKYIHTPTEFFKCAL